jgi:hypothetical protein
VTPDPETDKTWTWPTYVDENFTKRNIECFPQCDASEMLQRLEGTSFPFFIKTVNKNASRLIKSREDLETFFAWAKDKGDQFSSTGYIISDPMDIGEDDR